MHLKNRDPPGEVGETEGNLAVKAAGAQQRAVHGIRPVRRAEDYHRIVGIKTIHRDEQRVERLVVLLLRAAVARGARPSEGVNFVDEDDAGRGFARLLEE